MHYPCQPSGLWFLVEFFDICKMLTDSCDKVALGAIRLPSRSQHNVIKRWIMMPMARGEHMVHTLIVQTHSSVCPEHAFRRKVTTCSSCLLQNPFVGNIISVYLRCFHLVCHL